MGWKVAVYEAIGGALWGGRPFVGFGGGRLWAWWPFMGFSPFLLFDVYILLCRS